MTQCTGKSINDLEIWKIIPTATKYEASTLGRIRIIKTGKILSQFSSKSYTKGYLQCRIKFDDGLVTNRLVHRLICLTFLENPLMKEQVNHINGIKDDNRLNNLEWSTRSENIVHMYSTGLKKYKPLHYKGKFGKDHNRSKKVKCVETGEIFESMSEAEKKLKIGQGCVSWSIKHKKPIFNMHFEINQ